MADGKRAKEIARIVQKRQGGIPELERVCSFSGGSTRRSGKRYVFKKRLEKEGVVDRFVKGV